MKVLKFSKILVSYDAPLVVIALDNKGKSYIGVNYGDIDNGYKFYFARTKPNILQGFIEGSCDLLYLLIKKNIGKYYIGNGSGIENEIIEVEQSEKLAPEILPEPGVFITAIFEENSTKKLTVPIDGRWQINDLRKFADILIDSYAFVYALKGELSDRSRDYISELFHKYPWRGGFSSVNFFDDIYRQIPKNQKVLITEMKYASPGKIEMRMNVMVAKTLKQVCKQINDDNSLLVEIYKETHKWLKEQKWLRTSSKDIILTPTNKADLLEKVSLLTDAFSLTKEQDYILELSEQDPLSAVKILLAYYRRLERLADYIASGKAGELIIE